MVRARNSGESSQSRMKAFACFKNPGRDHLGGALIPEQKDGQAIVAFAFDGEDFFQKVPLPFLRFGAVDGNEPARFGVEALRQAPRVFVGDAADHPKALAFDGRGEPAHAVSGDVLGLVILVDDDDREFLQEIHWCCSSARRLAAPSMVSKPVPQPAAST